jgi:dienelactone hydrolase
MRLIRTFGIMIGALVIAAGADAQTIVREDLRIPMAGVGPRGLEALLVRPNEGGKFPLVLINHGSPREARDRPGFTPLAYLPQAMEFARRGFLALVPMPRGFGDSDSSFVEGNGGCANPDYVKAATVATADLRAAIAYATRRTDVDATRIVSVGQSVGGVATIALTANPPAGLLTAINFAGGSGSASPDMVCHEERLIEAFRFFGTRSRVPMLWVYSANDHYFGPALARRLLDAFTAGGGKVEFVAAPAFKEDGHELFGSRGISVWAPYVDKFLKTQNLVPRRTLLALPTPPKAPARLPSAARGGFDEFRFPAPHKAFAVSPRGAYGWRSGRRTVDEARSQALENCAKYATDCKIVVVDDAAVP